MQIPAILNVQLTPEDLAALQGPQGIPGEQGPAGPEGPAGPTLPINAETARALLATLGIVFDENSVLWLPHATAIPESPMAGHVGIIGWPGGPVHLMFSDGSLVDVSTHVGT